MTAPDAECQHCKGAGCVACSASHLPDPIDRALERLEVADREAETLFASTSLRYRILTDLDAEIRRDQHEMDLAMIHAQRDELNEVHARLAAVVEWLQTSLDCAITTGYGMEKEEIVDLLALARGEGGEQAGSTVRNDPEAPAAPDATLDEIVEEALVDYYSYGEGRPPIRRIIRAACIRILDGKEA